MPRIVGFFLLLRRFFSPNFLLLLKAAYVIFWFGQNNFGLPRVVKSAFPLIGYKHAKLEKS